MPYKDRSSRNAGEEEEEGRTRTSTASFGQATCSRTGEREEAF